MKRPNKPYINSLSNIQTKNNETTIHPLCQKTIKQNLKEENKINSRVFIVSGISIALTIGLYFLMNPPLWQAIITAAIITALIVFINSVTAYNILFNKKISQNIQQYPYLTISENSIRITDEDIRPETIYSIIHSNLKNINAMNGNELIKNGEHILIFTQNTGNFSFPYVVDTFKTVHTAVYSIPLNTLESPEQFTLSVQNFSQNNGIPFTLHESSVQRISNETVNIHKLLTQDGKVERSSLEDYTK